MAKEKLVYCRVCGAQIASKAKKCPQCGAKQKKGHGFRNLIILVILAYALYYAYSHGIGRELINKIRPRNDKPAVESVEKQADTNNETAVMPTNKPTVAPKENLEKEQAKETIEADAASDNKSNPSGINPDFKAFMDSYEDFMNEYCDFLEHYDMTDMSMLGKYNSLMQKAVEFEEKANQYNEDNLNAEEYKYYLDVMNRIQKRMVDISMY